MRLARAAAALAIVLLAAAPLGAQERRGSALEERLMAPCCWTQTLDSHDSPEARELRDEIDRRLEAGETIAQVEADLVARYGERIRAVPSEGFLDPIGLAVLVLLAGTALGLLALGRRWSRRAAEPVSATDDVPLDQASDAALGARLDSELEALSDA